MLCQCLRFQAQQALLPGGLISAVAPEDPNSSQTHRFPPSRGWRNASGAGTECPATAAGASAATAGRCRTVQDGVGRCRTVDADTLVATGSWVGPVPVSYQEQLEHIRMTLGACLGSVYCFLDETEYQSCDVPKPWLPKLACLCEMVIRGCHRYHQDMFCSAK